MPRTFGLILILVAIVGCKPNPVEAPPGKRSTTTSTTDTPDGDPIKTEVPSSEDPPKTEDPPVTPKKQPTEDHTFKPAVDKELEALKDVPVEDLVGQLKDEKQRTLASRALAARGSAAAEPLTKALDEEDPQARAAAAFALGQLGKDAASAKDRLKQMADSDESEVAKDAAAFALDALEEELALASTLRAASVQFQHAPGDKSANLATIERFVAAAADQRAELIAFSECCISGYWHLRHLSRDEMLALAEPCFEGPACQRLMQLAKQYRMSIGAGLVERDAEDRLYNTYVVAMPNGRFARHRKLHVFVSPHLSAGSEYTVFELPSGVRIGVLICYDNNIVENARTTALLGAEVLMAPHQTGGCKSGSPFAMGVIDREVWDRRHEDPAAIKAEITGTKGRGWLMRWLPARAHDNGMFLLFANGVGPDDNEVRTGNAMILDCYGRTLAETNKAGDDMIIADLDLTLRERCTGVRWIKARRPELYGALTQSTGKEQDTRKVRFEFDDDPVNRK